jgi:exopolyphosphatase/guanosine-5'-triphosphate,3'-diphosphate pyrophosphatase
MKLAAIDIGSNAVRLQIAGVNEDGGAEPLKRVEFIRIPVRLGDDAFRIQKISREKKHLFYKAMRAYKLLIEAFEVDHYMACATSAMREAQNAERILKHVYDEFGLKIEVINGKRENELILKSIMNYFDKNKNYLCIDVGGGSTEMTVITNRVVVNSASFDVGTVRLMDGAVKEKTWQTIEHWVLHKTATHKNLEAVVTSGTINKIFSIITGTSGNNVFTRDQLKIFHKKVVKMSYKERIEQLKLNPDRADIIEFSADIYLRILNWAGIVKIHSPQNSGLKDGILTELYERHVLNKA